MSSHIEMMQKGYQDFADGNIPDVLAVFHPDIQWQAAKGFPFYADNALYVGHDAVVQNVFSQIPEYYDEFHIEITDLIESGDRVVMVGYYVGVWKETGKRFKANATHVWTVKEGLLTNFFQAVDTAAIINP